MVISISIYIERILERLNMSMAKSICSPLAAHFKFSFEHCTISKKEKQEMKGVPCALAVSNFMYAMV